MKKISMNAAKLQLGKEKIAALAQPDADLVKGGHTTLVPLETETCPSQYVTCPQTTVPVSPVASLVVNSCTH